MLPREDQQPASPVLPPEELSPATNPLLARNLGRWAQAYFINPPEKRDQAVRDLLRQLTGDAPETLHTEPIIPQLRSTPEPQAATIFPQFQPSNHSAGASRIPGDLSPQRVPLFRTEATSGEPEPDAALVAEPLDPATLVAIPRDKHDVQWLNWRFASVTIGIAIIFAGLAWSRWMSERHHAPAGNRGAPLNAATPTEPPGSRGAPLEAAAPAEQEPSILPQLPQEQQTARPQASNSAPSPRKDRVFTFLKDEKPGSSPASRLRVAEAPQGHPVYPVSPAANVSGRVDLKIVIATDGRVKEVEVLTGKQVLAEAAVRAVKFWRYAQHELNGFPAEAETGAGIEFMAGDAVSLHFSSKSAEELEISRPPAVSAETASQ